MKYANTLGLLGQGISYSLSPWIHNAAAEVLGLPDRYRLFDLEPDAVAPFLQEFWAEGGVGLNVTQPYKRLVASLVRSDLAASNVLYREAASPYWKSTSTDGEGFVQALELFWGKYAFPHWVFLGNGGTVSILLDIARNLSPFPRISILRRDLQRDLELEALYPGVQFFPFEPSALAEVFTSGPCLLVQVSTAPAATWDPFFQVLGGFSGACMDLAYGSRCSSLFFALRAQRHPCEDGLAMLLEQARSAQKIWWGCTPSRGDLLAAMIDMAPQYGESCNSFIKQIQRLASM